MNEILQYDVVALIEDISEEHLRRGCVGTVIEKYSDKATGITYAIVVLRNQQLMKLFFSEQS